jgi:hypothetical protein
MKRKIMFDLMFLLFFLFFVRGGWLPIDIRLDSGDPPGASSSSNPQISSNGGSIYVVWNDGRNGGPGPDIYFDYSTDGGISWQVADIQLNTVTHISTRPQISSSGSNVYAVWEDYRNGNRDIYFNYSIDNGVTWQATDIRLDTGDNPGTSESELPQISSNGSNIYVVWEDRRNSKLDIYFNYSTDNGATWQATDIRLDKGDNPGANYSTKSQVSSSGSNVYVVWEDDRNGNSDIYFNYSTNSGVTWQATAIRIDTGDSPGANWSSEPQISSDGSNVYVVWSDQRDGHPDIYFNFSSDNGATWQATDIRLDTGDTAGTNSSELPQINSNGSNVYVVWADYRNGNPDIYFNYSTDGGVTWQASDTRLDTGDTPGVGFSYDPQISSSGSNVHVVWRDSRNGSSDIYHNTSINAGISWKTPDERVDTGDAPGANRSREPQMACLGNNAYIVWTDWRNGNPDIYFNTNSAEDPVPDIKANGSDGPITIIRSETLSITVEFDKGSFEGFEADWWLVAQTPFGWYHYHPTSGWLPGREVTLQIPLRDLPLREVLNMSGLPAGAYTFYFGVDLVKNGIINMGQAYYDSVEVTINP